MGETVFNSVIALVIGLPVSLILTECVSLATARGIGMGIIGHKFSLSLTAILWTVAGFLAVQLIAMFLLSIRFVRQEPAALLKSDVSETQKLPKTGKVGVAIAVAGMVMLAAAYILSIQQMGIFSYIVLIPVLILGIWGTFWLYKGMGALIGRRIMKKTMSRSGLYTFTGPSDPGKCSSPIQSSGSGIPSFAPCHRLCILRHRRRFWTGSGVGPQRGFYHYRYGPGCGGGTSFRGLRLDDQRLLCHAPWDIWI